jgi:retron-type reverse transcriptase
VHVAAAERVASVMSRRPVSRVAPMARFSGRPPRGSLPSWSDKLVGEVVRLLLVAYYEPRFSGRSHGFCPGRGCHTALTEVVNTWAGTTWFIEGDISDCFGSLDHDTMLGILGEKIHDNRFLRLLRHMLQAGYLETGNGTPRSAVRRKAG